MAAEFLILCFITTLENWSIALKFILNES